MNTPSDQICVKLNDKVDKGFIDNYLKYFNFFLSNKTREYLTKYFNEKKDEKTAKELWKNLLIDAISFLKINDSRENLFTKTKEKQDATKKMNVIDFFDNYEETRVYNCYGIEDLEEYFKDFVNFESVLYGTDGNYRDHVNHVIYVWSIGIILLFEFSLIDNLQLYPDSKVVAYSDIDYYAFTNKKVTKAAKYKTTRPNYFELIISRGEVIAIWTIIALCHDLGYPIEKASKINEKLKMIINHFGQIKIDEFSYNFSLLNGFLIEKFLNIISSKPDIKNKHTIIQEKYKDKLSKGLEDYRHGVFSSLLVFKTLTYFLETDYSDNGDKLSYEDLRQFFIRREILRSIASHTSPKLYHLNIRNLAFLLFVSDELNEWGRPNFEDFKSYGSKNINPDVYINCCKFGDNGDDLEIMVEYNYTDEDEIIVKNIKRKFRIFHHLLRTAKDDKQRTFIFSWSMKFKKIETDDKIFKFNYDSSLFPNEVKATINDSRFNFMNDED